MSRSDFIAPIILAIFAYFAAMVAKGFQGFVNESSFVKKSIRDVNLKHSITDNFIKHQDFLQKLQDAKLWEACDKEETRWFDHKNSEPQNIWEEISKQIWKDRPEFETAVGFEYWCNIVTEKRDLTWHIDKDEAELTQNDVLITPLMGSVYYGFPHHFEGAGELQLVDADATGNPLVFDTTRRDEVVAIEPIFNRMILFNASKWHKVTPITSGKRYSLAVNANSHKPKVMTKYGATDLN